MIVRGKIGAVYDCTWSDDFKPNDNHYNFHYRRRGDTPCKQSIKEVAAFHYVKNNGSLDGWFYVPNKRHRDTSISPRETDHMPRMIGEYNPMESPAEVAQDISDKVREQTEVFDTTSSTLSKEEKRAIDTKTVLNRFSLDVRDIERLKEGFYYLRDFVCVSGPDESMAWPYDRDKPLDEIEYETLLDACRIIHGGNCH